MQEAIAWVLFGGGFNIYLLLGYLLGPLKGQMPDRAYCTSAGTLLGSLLAFQGIEKTQQILMNEIKQTSDVFRVKDILGQVGDEIDRQGDGLATYQPLLALIRKYIIGKPSFAVKILRTNWTNGAPQYVTAFPDGTFSTEGDQATIVSTISDFQDAVCSSCLNVGLIDAFKDSKGNYWGDGGYNDLGPSRKAIQDGYENIILCLTGLFNDPAVSGKPGDLIDSDLRGYSILVHRVMQADVLLATHNPTVKTQVLENRPVGKADAFDAVSRDANIKLGSITTLEPGSNFLG